MSIKKILFLLVFGVAFIVGYGWAEDGKTSQNTIDITKMTCKELMSGSDIDREVGIAFFHGYMAGKNNNAVINLSDTSSKSDEIMDYCLSNPKSTVMGAFLNSNK